MRKKKRRNMGKDRRKNRRGPVWGLLGLLIFLTAGGYTAGHYGQSGAWPWQKEQAAAPLAGNAVTAVEVLDVGQASSMLSVCDGKAVLIDTGDTDSGSTVLSALKKYGISRLDLLILTHAHADHIGGASAVLAQVPAEQIWMPDVEASTGVHNYLLQQAERQDIPVIQPEPGTVWGTEHGRLEVLAPEKEWLGREIRDADEAGDAFDYNDSSLGVRFDCGDFSLLCYGDGELPTEKQLLKTGKVTADIDVLIVAHHGSSNASGKELLEAVSGGRPGDIAVISAGKGNSYGHPTEKVLDRLEDAGFRILRTDENGAVSFQVDAEGGFDVCTDYK